MFLYIHSCALLPHAHLSLNLDLAPPQNTSVLPSFFAPALALLEGNVEDAAARVANNERRRAAQVPFAVFIRCRLPLRGVG